MASLFRTVKDIIRQTVEYHTESPAAVFKAFISFVLVQFALLSLVSVTTGVKDIPVAEGLVDSVHFWWGLLGLFGAASLIFEKFISGDKAVLTLGYLSAITSFVILSYDFAASRPPVLTGGILSVTASIFLGGLLYGKIKRVQ